MIIIALFFKFCDSTVSDGEGSCISYTSSQSVCACDDTEPSCTLDPNDPEVYISCNNGGVVTRQLIKATDCSEPFPIFDSKTCSCLSEECPECGFKPIDDSLCPRYLKR